MATMVQADATGTLTIPACAQPGARFDLEASGGVVILRLSDRERPTTGDDPAAWLRPWIATLPASAALHPEATRRDAIYE